MTMHTTVLHIKPHGIPRAEWVRRFCDEVKRVAGVGDDVAAAELESFPENDDDWTVFDPESCARESLSHWDDDGE